MRASFEPIAIIGQGCVLPGALTPDALWELFRSGTDGTSQCPADRWRLSREDALREVSAPGMSDRGGYVRDFESVFNPDGFRIPAERVRQLDLSVQWLLHAARESLRSAGCLEAGRADSPRIGAVVGNLSFPSDSLARWTEGFWLDSQGSAFLGGRGRELAGFERPPAANRFMSGLPALLLAEALGLDAGAFALDAACASSLYAIKLACDRLHDRRADVMLAGAVCRADDLFIHVGFTALQALSPSGRSRPFHQGADGLLPAEGAALLTLKRLDDAVAAGDPILGLIRGIGLSNDGRSAGLLVPSASGQVRAIRQAYERSGLQPRDISLIECHATGTPLGDATELASMGEVFAGLSGIPIGSAKSNLGHGLTVAGAIGVMKVLGAMRAGLRPPTLHIEEPIRTIENSPFRLLAKAEPWTSEGPRRAGVSAFGFGGNNAHLLLEEWIPHRPPRRPHVVAAVDDVAIVGLGACVADGRDLQDFSRAWLTNQSRVRERDGAAPAGFADAVALPLHGLRFPPADLAHTLAQQLLVLRAAGEAVAAVRSLPAAKTGVYVGMQCDAVIARGGLRARLQDWTRQWVREGFDLPRDWLDRARDSSAELLTAAGVIGKMPNIVTNRLNRQFDFAGPSFSVSSEEASGLDALDVACRALQAGEIDAAVVGAVDLSCEPAHGAAALAVLPADRQVPGDGAVVFVLKRLADARRDGDEVWAVLPADPSDTPEQRLGLAADVRGLTPLFGHSHAASGLLHVAAAAVACRHRVRWPEGTGAPVPWLSSSSRPSMEVVVTPMLGESRRVSLEIDRDTAPLSSMFGEIPRLHVFSGRDREAVLQSLEQRRESNDGPARLVLLATDAEMPLKSEEARNLLERGVPPRAGLRWGDGIYFRERPMGGELAFVFTGPGGAYPGMGCDVLCAFPEVLDGLARFDAIDDAAAWVFSTTDDAAVTATDKLWGASLLSQAHAIFSREVLGLTPQASIGFCSGETNALYAFGVWQGLSVFRDAIVEEKVYERDLGGEFAVARQAWEKRGLEPSTWETWRITATEESVRAALASEPDAHLTIVNAPGDVVIAGRAEACARVVAKVGPERASSLSYNLTIHCPEMEAYAATWRKLHHRPTTPVAGVRFYTHATCAAYEPTMESVADALVGQALHTVDFPRLIRQAWDDGVRVFVEHGPQGGCSSWIRRTLGDREHLAVPLDLRGESSLTQALRTAAELVAAGVAFDVDAFNVRLARISPVKKESGPEKSWPAHPEPIRFPVVPERQVLRQSVAPSVGEVMAPAPWLPPVLCGDPGVTRVIVERPRQAAPGSFVAEVDSGARSALMQRFQQHTAQLTVAHEQFVATTAAAFRTYLGALTDCEGPPSVTRALGPTAAPAPAFADAPFPIPAERSAMRSVEGPAERQLKSTIRPPTAAQTEQRKRDEHVLPRLPKAPIGPRYSRQQLEILASGEISSVFGPLFQQQDGFARQVRMPEPPLLLADRVLGIEGAPGVLGLGTIWTETEVTSDAWYLKDGRMPLGLLIESGQADLLLISWMGIDFHNRGERVYRLLGCDLMLHGPLPKEGETLRYEITIDGHAEQGDVRLFFFHYDCRVDGELRMTVRNGQAGFFSPEDLRTSAGVLWSAETGEHAAHARVDPPRLEARRRYSRQQVKAFSEGRVFDCFGAGFEITQAQVQPPRIQGGRMQLFDEVLDFDPTGGPWKRGYLRARVEVTPDHWTMQGHFKNDPCMPGTLMCEAGFQAMSFYLTAMGYTLDRDAWRFEPVTEERFDIRCRGQVLPTTREIIYELFVEEIIDGDTPTIYADLLGTADGQKAFHGRRVALRLVQDWPLATRPELLVNHVETRPVARLPNGFAFDYKSILSAAWGRPSDAFGPAAEPFVGLRRLPRLPGPPYLFMSRVRALEGEYLSMKAGAVTDVEYDVPVNAWYFDDNGSRTMPFAVLLEAALQPCGWLTAYVGCPFTSEKNLLYRNLEGTGTLRSEIPPDAGILESRTKLTSLVVSGDMMLEAFEVSCSIAGRPVFDITTRFGHFPPEALADQVGLRTTDEDRARLVEASPFEVDLTKAPERFFSGSLRLATGRLLVLDRLTGYWPAGGRAGLGRMRSEKSIRPSDWFFKMHFYEDPVQPGSLGIEAMIQLLQAFMLERDLGSGIENPRFEALAVGLPFEWKYRGQVTPQARTVVVELEVTSITRDARGAVAVADSSLWVDGRRIYETTNLSMRIVPAGAAS